MICADQERKPATGESTAIFDIDVTSELRNNASISNALPRKRVYNTQL
jgi:hypothetical protein